MAPSTTGIEPITLEIMKLERQIRSLKWWEVATKIHLKSKLHNLKVIAVHIGFATAMDDLVKCGILEEIKNN